MFAGPCPTPVCSALTGLHAEASSLRCGRANPVALHRDKKTTDGGADERRALAATIRALIIELCPADLRPFLQLPDATMVWIRAVRQQTSPSHPPAAADTKKRSIPTAASSTAAPAGGDATGPLPPAPPAKKMKKSQVAPPPAGPPDSTAPPADSGAPPDAAAAAKKKTKSVGPAGADGSTHPLKKKKNKVAAVGSTAAGSALTPSGGDNNVGQRPATSDAEAPPLASIVKAEPTDPAVRPNSTS